MTLIFLFIIGLSVGSFLGVLADRLYKGEDIVFKRSHCDNCKKILGIGDLVPLFSYLFLGGRCRYCRKQLSLKYPLVELTSGLGFVYLYTHLNFFALPSPTVISFAYLFFIFSQPKQWKYF